MTSKEIRRKFLEFFESKGHVIVPSAPMVVKNDPTLMFTNAGMNQFKDIFLGNKTTPFNRATDSQKCLRVSGKHNDLEEVGHDTYHHTMFEMLGNWSFGDYFKQEAIDWAWELLTEVYKIDKSLLYATVFEGSAEDGTSLDEEARQAWLKHLPADHVILGNKHDNFWEMGDTGPCGPSSEIHIDIRTPEEKAASGIPGCDLVNQSDPHVIEIWNLVFMQFQRFADGHLEPLPAKNIDTGMGFERLCAVLQGKNSNYDSDVFTGMLNKIGELSGHKYGENKDADVAMRVIADHIRAISFSIADGQLPSNVKAGYVIRRILRRAVRYGYTFLGLNDPFLCRLVPQLVDDMGEAYPELPAQQKLIESVIREEELAFLRTLDRGIKLLDECIERNKASKLIPGEDAFRLYDTYGFPIDLTELIAAENGFKVDLEGFQVELGKQKDRARNATANSFGDWTVYHEGEDVEFLGYDSCEVEGALLLKQRTVVQKNKEMLQLVFDRTPFYGEMGGEIGDTGFITSADGEQIRILNTVKENELTIHIAERLPKNCEGAFTLTVESCRRCKIAANHSCTHLLHRALREILGNHVEQKGSFVSDKGFRFDFSHFEKLSDEQILAVEKRVNELIRSNFGLEEKRDATMPEAQAMGAMALFGEKYGETVRVVSMGKGESGDVEADYKEAFSVELCGGTHVSNTSDIQQVKILSESGVAAGVRRIEALTGNGVINYYKNLESMLLEAASTLKTQPNEVVNKIKHLQSELKSANSEIESLKSKAAKEALGDVMGGVEEVKGIKLLANKVDNVDMNGLRDLGDSLKEKLGEGVVALMSAADGKVNIVIMATDGAVKAGAHAGNLIKAVAPIVGGGGGGRPNMAQAGGKNPAGIEDALKAVKSELEKML